MRDGDDTRGDRERDATGADGGPSAPEGAATDLADVALDLTPEAAVADSLNSALQHLRESADRMGDLTDDDARVAAAEDVAEQAATLDEQIGAIARKDDH